MSVRGFVVVALIACAHAKPAAPPDPVRAEIDQADAAEKARRHDEARLHYERAIALAKDPKTSAVAHREYAEMLAQWGELEAARTHYETAVAAAPDDAMAWHDLGLVRAQPSIHDMTGAFAAFERAKQLAPHAWIPRRELAVLHWKLGQRAEALAEYRDMLRLDLPARLREKVQWAIDQLSKPASP